jgi:hypothetical protein
MSPEWVSILALVALFVIGTVLPINMGALAFVAAWLVGMHSLGLEESDIIAGISGDLVLTLVGVTYLFAIARNKGTVDRIVRKAVIALGFAGRYRINPLLMGTLVVDGAQARFYKQILACSAIVAVGPLFVGAVVLPGWL